MDAEMLLLYHLNDMSLGDWRLDNILLAEVRQAFPVASLLPSPLGGTPSRYHHLDETGLQIAGSASESAIALPSL